MTGFKAIPAIKIIKDYAAYNGGPVATRALLAYHLREGNIRARASLVWTSRKASLRDAWRSKPSGESLAQSYKKKGHVILSKAKWWRSVDWPSDIENWNIRAGRFVVTLRSAPVRRLMIAGIRFHSGDVRDCFDPSRNGGNRRAPGAIPDKEKWRRFWWELIRLIQTDREDFGALSKVGLASHEKLAKAIHEGIAYELDFETIKAEVEAFRAKFRLTRPKAAAGAKAKSRAFSR